MSPTHAFYNYGHSILRLYQIFPSPQVHRSMIISNKQRIFQSSQVTKRLKS